MNNNHRLASFIRQYYPQYWGIQTYPVNLCCPIRKVSDDWGILGNFGNVPIVLNGITFKNTEQLYHLFKFNNANAINDIYNSAPGMGVKMKARHWEKSYRRDDWGKIFIDVMKYVLTIKYQQSELFRQTLSKTGNWFIVEDETSRKKGKPADCWGVVNDDNGFFTGPNLLGRLLMELRKDNGEMTFSLPDDAFEFLHIIKKP